jgi:hypothetical protein
MTVLGKIQGMTIARFLTSNEIDLLDCLIGEFIRIYSSSYPEDNITPKMHWLSSHVMPFVRRHKTWGLISEQSIEAFHALFNKVERRYCNVRDEKIRLKKMAVHFCTNKYLSLF